MSHLHRMPIEIGFKHCDPAGIVFYPRYVEMLSDTVEHWFKHGLSTAFDVLHGERQTAIPVISLQCDFRVPSRLGAALVAELEVERIGRSSVTILIGLSSAGADKVLKMKCRLVIVFTHIETMASMEIPADLRAAIQHFVAAPHEKT